MIKTLTQTRLYYQITLWEYWISLKWWWNRSMGTCGVVVPKQVFVMQDNNTIHIKGVPSKETLEYVKATGTAIKQDTVMQEEIPYAWYNSLEEQIKKEGTTVDEAVANVQTSASYGVELQDTGSYPAPSRPAPKKKPLNFINYERMGYVNEKM